MPVFFLSGSGFHGTEFTPIVGRIPFRQQFLLKLVDPPDWNWFIRSRRTGIPGFLDGDDCGEHPLRRGGGAENGENLFVRGGRGGARRTATATPFCPRRTRRGTENGNCNTFLSAEGAEGRGELPFFRLSHAKGRGELLLVRGGRRGARRRATATPICPRRDAEGRGEGQLKHLFFHGGHGGARRTATATPFYPRRTRRGTENGNCNTPLSAEGAEGRGERRTPFCPRRTGIHGFLDGDD